MGGHVLADGGEGETPLVPVPISHACDEAAAAGVSDSVQPLSNALLGVLNLALDPAARPVISPRWVSEHDTVDTELLVVELESRCRTEN